MKQRVAQKNILKPSKVWSDVKVKTNQDYSGQLIKYKKIAIKCRLGLPFAAMQNSF